jgi:hypothetical protein
MAERIIQNNGGISVFREAGRHAIIGSAPPESQTAEGSTGDSLLDDLTIEAYILELLTQEQTAAA